MADLIDRKDLSMAIMQGITIAENTFQYASAVQYYIDQAPTVDAEPVVHARWEKHYDEDGEEKPYRTCSNCCYPTSSRIWIDGNYCPNCGAKMDKEAQNG